MIDISINHAQGKCEVCGSYLWYVNDLYWCGSGIDHYTVIVNDLSPAGITKKFNLQDISFELSVSSLSRNIKIIKINNIKIKTDILINYKDINELIEKVKKYSVLI